MNLKLIRDIEGPGCTLGQLFVDGVFECYTCEDVERLDGDKVPGQTAIPRGTYRVVVTYSNRFKRNLPLLENVPNFAGVRIHSGNTAFDTEGCILPGRTLHADRVGESRLAFDALFEKIRGALNAGESVSIEVTGA